MLKFLIILLGWTVPGILLFLYLLWISKRFAPTLEEQQVTPPNGADADLFANENHAPDRRAFEHWDAASR
jgi:hypothetical protein